MLSIMSCCFCAVHTHCEGWWWYCVWRGKSRDQNWECEWQSTCVPSIQQEYYHSGGRNSSWMHCYSKCSYYNFVVFILAVRKSIELFLKLCVTASSVATNCEILWMVIKHSLYSFSASKIFYIFWNVLFKIKIKFCIRYV